MPNPKIFRVEDIYGNLHLGFTEEKYAEFTREGIQLKRQISGTVWRRNAPWKESVWWDAVDEDDPETGDERRARREDEYWSEAIYLCDVDGREDVDEDDPETGDERRARREDVWVEDEMKSAEEQQEITTAL